MPQKCSPDSSKTPLVLRLLDHGRLIQYPLPCASGKRPAVAQLIGSIPLAAMDTAGSKHGHNDIKENGN